ncbi:apses-domain-containing protein [Coniophora puteana RWD-64-598 SS2]|uniref:Apses-domain-containing protein n=1 Tax=Coniophora puteana (strain RWD-64-598) TaxID=741705 RepID=A0A5M3MKA3_CONPW|nr:apses-domain-containing protein [Coniophora puteana RWD-64-598 SS2]EIW79380.1 apses-domain-containing protein [Coniophora puteana RWD-64-598 SS2]
MQSSSFGASQANQVKIYNAVYSSVQVYECMVRGIAVMRRRADSFVNATQILKVAGIDKGRRTKILEKEILPGKHEIVQGGYGKYQGTWIPLERGREIAMQYGIASLLAPLFDFTPTSNSLGSLPSGPSAASPRPLSAASSFSSIGGSGNYGQPGLAPPPIMPGSALRLLNQGRAQGLFTPSTSAAHALSRQHPYSASFSQGTYSPFSGVSPTPPPVSSQSLKRARSESEVLHNAPLNDPMQRASQPLLEASPDIQVNERNRTHLSTSQHVPMDVDGPSPVKRSRQGPTPPQAGSSAAAEYRHSQPTSHFMSQSAAMDPTRPASRSIVMSPPIGSGATVGTASASSSNGKAVNGKEPDIGLRFSTKPIPLREPNTSLRDARRTAIVAAICRQDDPAPVLHLLREITTDPSAPIDVDTILDDKSHTALHLAASMGRLRVVEQLVNNGADVHRGNSSGETPLIRASIDTHNFDQQTFQLLVPFLQGSIRTLDMSRKSVVHHIMYLAGVAGRAVCARYYLDQIFLWIAQNQGGDFRSIVDLQDENGDTALNIAARVGNRSLVRSLLDVGANRILPNKLGLRPGDFGVEVEELSGGPRAEDLLASLRSGPSAPVQKSQDIISEMTTMIQSLSSEFSSEVKSKQDSLDVTQAHLRAATRELSEQRKQIQLWQSRCGELDQAHQRIRNLEKAITDEDGFDWTGRTDLSGRNGGEDAGPAFQWRGPSSTMAGIGGPMDMSFSIDTEPPIPAGSDLASLIRLRRLKTWHTRMEELMAARLKSLQGASAEREFQCKKIVALCTGIPLEKVEEMLENLVIAMESESQVVDIVRVSGFMQKVRDGLI